MLYAFYDSVGETTGVLIGLAVILISGFMVTRITNLMQLPKVSGYILAGVLIGPGLLHLMPDGMVDHMDFLNDIALAFIAFGAGKFFRVKVLREAGWRIIWITFCEALAAGILVTLVMRFVLGMDMDFALILGAIATATAPASTMMTIQQYHARGDFVNTLLQVVALDDAVCLLAYSLVITLVNAGRSGQVQVLDVALPILWNLLAIVLGLVCGIILGKLITPARSKDNRLILVLAMLLGISGICACFDVSPLLSCMVFGAVYINMTKDKKLYRQIQNFTPPVMSLFFIVSGMSLDLGSIRTAGVIGAVYFIVRIAGKYFGTWFSCRVAGKSREICRYLGLALVPQAGVAIGLAFMGERQLPAEMGSLLLTIILSSSVLYELVGPVTAKKALQLAGVIPGRRGEEPENNVKNQNGEKSRDSQIAQSHEKPRVSEKAPAAPGMKWKVRRNASGEVGDSMKDTMKNKKHGEKGCKKSEKVIKRKKHITKTGETTHDNFCHI